MQRLNLADTPTQTVLDQTIAVLAKGGLVLFPTETTYGAGVDALNPAAVQKLLRYKSRREGKPLSIAVDSLAMAEKYVDVNESAKRLYARFLPGPVTVISHSRGKVAPGVESEFSTLGVRIPDYELVLKIVARYGKPITATSANASDAKRPYTVEDVLGGLSAQQKSLIDLILDAGELPHNAPSTVIDTTLSTPIVFRQGEIEVAPVNLLTTLTSQNEAETKAIAGRLLLKHWNDVKETGLMIGLNGSLGAGKTIFTKGLAEFLQIRNPLTSPTYTYVQEYDFARHQVHGKLFHLDVWRIDSPAELERLELANMLQPNQVVVIEWAQKVASALHRLIQDQAIPYLEVTLTQPSLAEMHIRKIEIKE